MPRSRGPSGRGCVSFFRPPSSARCSTGGFMDTTPLCVFVTKVTASNRIVFGDLRRLRRDVLPTGATSREEIETLLSLDSLGQLDDDWPEYLITTVKVPRARTSVSPLTD